MSVQVSKRLSKSIRLDQNQFYAAFSVFSVLFSYFLVQNLYSDLNDSFILPEQHGTPAGLREMQLVSSAGNMMCEPPLQSGISITVDSMKLYQVPILSYFLVQTLYSYLKDSFILPEQHGTPSGTSRNATRLLCWQHDV